MKSKSFINDLFELKSDEIYTVTKNDREQLNNLKQNSVDLNQILNIAKNSNINYKQFKEKIDIYLDDINIEQSYQNKKIYKIGFIDAIKLMVESLVY